MSTPAVAVGRGEVGGGDFIFSIDKKIVRVIYPSHVCTNRSINSNEWAIAADRIALLIVLTSSNCPFKADTF